MRDDRPALTEGGTLAWSAFPQYDCVFQGLSAGWADVYSSDLDCQWLDVTGVPEGDYLLRMEEAPAPDLVFYDPFSFKTDSPLWSLDAFRRLFMKCERRRTELYTSSSSPSSPRIASRISFSSASISGRCSSILRFLLDLPRGVPRQLL